MTIQDIFSATCSVGWVRKTEPSFFVTLLLQFSSQLLIEDFQLNSQSSNCQLQRLEGIDSGAIAHFLVPCAFDLIRTIVVRVIRQLFGLAKQCQNFAAWTFLIDEGQFSHSDCFADAIKLHRYPAPMFRNIKAPKLTPWRT